MGCTWHLAQAREAWRHEPLAPVLGLGRHRERQGQAQHLNADADKPKLAAVENHMPSNKGKSRGEDLRKARLGYVVSIRNIARYAGVSPSMATRWEGIDSFHSLRQSH